MEKNECVSTSVQPLVSIGMPVFNGEKYLQQALDSVLAQDYANLEIIISDNASTDKTAEICQSYMQKDKRIRYHRYAENEGAKKNFDFVLQEAKGSYFTWLACDDSFDSPAFISLVVNFLESHADVVLCGCSIRTFYEEDHQSTNIRTFEMLSNDKDWKKARLEFFKYPPKVELILYGIYRTEILKKISIAHKNMKHRDLFAPFLILPRLCPYGRIVAIPDVLRAYRCNVDSLAYSIEGMEFFWYAQRLKVTVFQLALNFKCSWQEKLSLLRVALNNFNPFKRSVSMKHELKLLRKEVAMLRKACVKRLAIINQLNAQIKK